MSKLFMEIVFVVMATFLADQPEVRPVNKSPDMSALVKLKSGALVVPAEVQGEPGEFVVIATETSGKKVVFYAIDPGLKRFPPELLNTSKAAVYTAAKSGKYRVLIYTAVNDEPTEPQICVVTIGNPEPGPAPDLPPLAKKFKELLQMEQQADKYPKAKLLVTCMETAAEMANNPQYKNAGELESAIRTATVAKMGQGQLPLVGKAIGETVANVVGDNPETPLTAEVRGMLNTIYSKSAIALKLAIAE